MKKYLLISLLLLFSIAIQAQVIYNVTVHVYPEDSGAATGDGTYNYGETCTLIATANEGYHFENWTENDSIIKEAGDHYSFNVYSNHIFYANFVSNTHQVTVTVANVSEETPEAAPSEPGTVDGAGTYDHNGTCTLTAEPNVGFHFVNWTENNDVVSDTATYQFRVTEDCSLVANFALDTHDITLEVENGSATGAGTYYCYDICTLTASADEGYHFLNWTEKDTVFSDSANHSFIVMEDHKLVANFEPNAFTINTIALPKGGGEVNVTGAAVYNGNCILTANANEHYSFSGWSDNVSDNPRQITVFSDTTFTANFKLKLPEVGTLSDPSPICPGSALVLEQPTTSIADTAVWQIAPDSTFQDFQEYSVDQPLDASYNGWYLRFCASNTSGETYSNVVTITMIEFSPILYGEEEVCSNTTTEYYVEGADNADIQWSLSDTSLKIIGEGDSVKVHWAVNADTLTLSAFVKDTVTWCTSFLEKTIVVTSDIKSANRIAERKKDGVTYLLIYSNPETTPYQYQWYYNDRIIPCSKQYLYTPISEGGLVPGRYRVYISNKEDEDGNLICGAFSPEIVVKQTSSQQLSIFPNPTHSNDQVTIINEESGVAQLAIYSVDGRLIYQQTVDGYQVDLHLSLPKGVYIVRLTSPQSTKTGKIVIE